ncbi:MAG: CYTH domain-containing protein [Lachnoclostridium sp.]|jgi:CYTH domain-containing protein|nr:CYTH domain-containing protein [Lachnoclostridium sp.]
MEIERKYLVKEIPENISKYPRIEIEQAYLATNPTIRIRRWGNEYLLCYKSGKGIVPVEGTIVVREEELPLTKSAYDHLKEKKDGRIIEKTRYFIPLTKNLKAELDLFHGYYEGRVLAEVEFSSVEEAEQFIKPEWFGENVSDRIEYSNSYMSQN